MEVIFLGTGTSHGIPVIGCSCPVCTSDDARNNRTRASVYVRTDDADIISDVSDYSIKIPDNNDFSLPFTATVALQLLAYYTARAMGRDIDKPRNLAKSVTVE